LQNVRDNLSKGIYPLVQSSTILTAENYRQGDESPCFSDELSLTFPTGSAYLTRKVLKDGGRTYNRQTGKVLRDFGRIYYRLAGNPLIDFLSRKPGRQENQDRPAKKSGLISLPRRAGLGCRVGLIFLTNRADFQNGAVTFSRKSIAIFYKICYCFLGQLLLFGEARGFIPLSIDYDY
jgi:hypothetical protein